MTDRYFKLGKTVVEERFIANNSPERWSLVAVIDPTDRAAVERLIRLQVGASAGCPDALEVSEKQIDRMAAALREFAAPTPKPTAPANWGAVVEDNTGAYWTLYAPEAGLWINYREGKRVYADINAVRIVHAGVES